ncbi:MULTISPECIES: RNase A-like domain-containing protein [unclassified Bacillus (in: firmicutes)]|uniref:RNase A-like domain-containing protein n=1 Tax=unclassified Bacillus (in: firmicutes) TaxID=185979 RepID=UPI0030FC6133
MSLNMYLGEVQSQTQSMNAVCIATIQGMEQAIQSIDAFAIDTVLQGLTYSSAKAFFVQTFRPLAQGIIYLCEELIRQNDAFPSQFQSKIASTDVIEQELLEQIREIDRMKASMEAINQAMPIPGMDAMANLFTVMRKKLQEKLEHLYEFNYTSSSNYDTALQLAASIATGLAEVQSGKGFSPASGTFSTQGLNMEWTTSIQAITEEKKHHSKETSIIEETLFDKLKDTVENNVEAMDQLYEKFIRQIENTPIIGQYHNYKKGQNEAVLDELKGILNTILHPIDSVEGAVYALSHIDETFAAVEQAISDSWNQDVVNGDWNSRAKWVGNVEMQVKLAIAELFVGTKGVDKISKLGKVSKLGKTSKLSESVNFIQGIKNVINFDKFKQSVDMLNNILMPKNQFALADTNAFNLKSFDYSTFNKAKDTFSFAENIDRSNQYSPRVFDGDLKKHEDKGGHLIERHVEIPDEALAQRLIDDQNITGSSSFNDLEKAQKVADAVLTNPQNIRKIERWLADPYSPPTLALRYRGDEIIGRSILRTSEDVLEVTNAKIVLKKDGEGSYIRTGFPIR